MRFMGMTCLEWRLTLTRDPKDDEKTSIARDCALVLPFCFDRCDFTFVDFRFGLRINIAQWERGTCRASEGVD